MNNRISDNHEERFLTPSDAAKRLNLTLATIHSWRKRGHLIAVELPNGRYAVPESEVERLLRRHQARS